MKTTITSLLLATLLSACVLADEGANTTEDGAVYPVAVLPLQDRSKEVAGQGKIVADILFANLVVDPSILLVDREDIETVLKEQELNISGIVNPNQAVQVGNIIGAKILVIGSIVQADKTRYLVAKIIGTETTRVLGVSAKGTIDEPIENAAEKLAIGVAKTILKDGSKLVAKPLTCENRLETLKEKIKDKMLPTIWIDIPEEHLSRRVIDPAAETELTLFCKELGFTVLDKKIGDKSKAEILLVGEAFSERTMPVGNLISVKARVELKAVDPKSREVIAIDRQTTVAVDLVETIAAKNALQQAGAILAERFLPKIVK